MCFSPPIGKCIDRSLSRISKEIFLLFHMIFLLFSLSHRKDFTCFFSSRKSSANVNLAKVKVTKTRLGKVRVIFLPSISDKIICDFSYEFLDPKIYKQDSACLKSKGLKKCLVKIFQCNFSRIFSIQVKTDRCDSSSVFVSLNFIYEAV